MPGWPTAEAFGADGETTFCASLGTAPGRCVGLVTKGLSPAPCSATKGLRPLLPGGWLPCPAAKTAGVGALLPTPWPGLDTDSVGAQRASGLDDAYAITGRTVATSKLGG